MTPVDEAIMTMVRTMPQTHYLRNSVTQVLDVQTNLRKAFCLWFSSEALAIPDPRWNAFKHEAIQLLENYELYRMYTHKGTCPYNRIWGVLGAL